MVIVAGSTVEGVVEDVAGPTDDGTGWTVLVALETTPYGDPLSLFAEEDLEPTGLLEDDDGNRLSIAALPEPEERSTQIELHIATDIVDGIEAARVAETIERDLVELLGGGTVGIEATRHWSEPYLYELDVIAVPQADAVGGLRELVAEGGDGWLSCRDDGWRVDLWWHAADDEAVFLTPEIRGVEIAYRPWESPLRRPKDERPLVSVVVSDLGDAQSRDEEA